MKPTIALIGGTGKSGRYLVEQLLGEEYHFKILLRDLEKFPIKSPLITTVKGDARNYDDIYKLTAGCHAVISTLGQPKGEPPIFTSATANVLRAMDVHGIKRYILTTGLNVDTPFDNKGTAASLGTIWMKTNYAATTIDKQLEYELLVNSGVNWTLVRLPLIELTDAVSEINVGLEDCPGDKISAGSLANFLIEQLHNDAYYRKAPFIANVYNCNWRAFGACRFVSPSSKEFLFKPDDKCGSLPLFAVHSNRASQSSYLRLHKVRRDKFYGKMNFTFHNISKTAMPICLLLDRFCQTN